MNANFRIFSVAIFMIAYATAASAETAIQVAKAAGSGRCVVWMKKLSEARFVTENKEIEGGLTHLTAGRDIPVERLSCHTAPVAGYGIDGNIPQNDITRLLRKLAATIGRAVPGGLSDRDFGENADAYGLVLAKSIGTTELYSFDLAT